MDNEPHSEDLFLDSEDIDAGNAEKNTTEVEEHTEKEETNDTQKVLRDDQETPDIFVSDKVPETETFEEPLRLLGTNDETPDLLEEGEKGTDEIMSEEEVIEDEEINDLEIENETPDLDLEGDEDVVAESEPIIVKPMELKQAEFTSDKKKTGVNVSKERESDTKLINLPLGRVKNIMKLDPDVRLMSGEAIFAVTKATELFIMALAKECMVHKDPKKKTIQKRDFDQVLASTDSLRFLEGAMDF